MKILANPEDAAVCLLAGGIVAYPTETFYALGCLADHETAAEHVYRVKGREAGKPLPVLAASMEQAGRAVNLAAAPDGLLSKFWPGPLTVLLPGKNLASAAINSRGQTAIRIDNNPLARELARLCGGALTASSANMAGKAAPRALSDFSSELISRMEALGDLAAILAPAAVDRPKGGLPSTIVEVLPHMGNNVLHILRAGAVAVERLTAAGFCVV